MTVILANGEYPSVHSHPRAILESADRVVACDGAAKRYWWCQHRRADYVIGDLDSIGDDAERYAVRVIRVEEQNTNDLTKAIEYCRKRGWTDLAIVGATGKREDHSLGNIFRAMEAGVKVYTERGMFLPLERSTDGLRLKIDGAIGAAVSVFATDPATRMTSKGLAWPLEGVEFKNLYCATLNRVDSPIAEIVSDHPAFIFRVYQ